ncbi:MAG: hypothetical protein U0939_13150 [Pirellulales bacterium]
MELMGRRAAWAATALLLWATAAVRVDAQTGNAVNALSRDPLADAASPLLPGTRLQSRFGLEADPYRGYQPPPPPPEAVGPMFPRGYEPGDLQLASRQNELPIPLPQDAHSGYPPHLPLAVEDDQLMFEGPQITSFKNGFFQKLSLGGTWVAGDSSPGSLGIVESEAFVTVAVPMPKREWPMLITPYLNVRTLDGPGSPDLPPVLYETYVDFMWVPKLMPNLLGILAITPAVYSDFEQGSADGFRWTGKGLVRWDIQPDTLQFMIGVLYLNRIDVKILPAGGFIWRPSPDWDLEAVFPRPKFAKRMSFTPDSEDWVYIAGEFGGNSFAIADPNGAPDVIALRDWRFMLGYERRRNGGAGHRFEVGYVFNRSVEYFYSNTPEYYPNDTFMLRLVGTF